MPGGLVYPSPQDIADVIQQSSPQKILARQAYITAERSFLEFVKQAWPIIEPKVPLHINWHVECIAEHLQALTERQIQKCIFNVPPGFLKSILISVLWPAWHWIKCTSDRILSASFKQDLAIRDASRTKDIIKSEWYRDGWGKQVSIRRGFDGLEYYVNTELGWRKAVHVGGGTGDRASVRIVDDPHNIHEANSKVMREGVVNWVKDTWFQRGADPRTNLEVYVMQRVHERDVAGYLMDEVGGYTLVILPMEYVPHRKFISTLKKPMVPEDPRTEKGQLLDPGRISAKEVERIKSVLGAYGASGQLQQQPAPDAGGIFKKHWWRVWHYPDQPLPDYELTDAGGTVHVLKSCPLPHDFDREVQSWDMSFEDGEQNDYVSGQYWGKREANVYGMDYLLAKMDFVKTAHSVERMSEQYIAAGKTLVEEAANGPAIISSLRSKVPGIVGVRPKGSKVARASAYSTYVESGNCYLPHPLIAKWTLQFIDNMAVFPNGQHDDDVDAWSQMMNELYGKAKLLVPCISEFERHIHLSQKPLKPVQGLRAFRFWYPGVYPVCIIGQITRKGGIVVYHVLQGDNIGFEEFIRMRVLPVVNEWYRWPLDWVDVGPPKMMMAYAKDADAAQRPGETVSLALGTSVVIGNKEFLSRLECAREIFNRRSGILINCERTPGETGHHLVEALTESYGYELDPVTQHVKRERPFDAVSGYAVGEALTHGLCYFFGEPVRPYQKRFEKKEQQRRANSYAVE